MPAQRPPTILSALAAAEHRTNFSQTLQNAGFDVQNTACGAETLRLAVAKMPDVILLDLNLPDMTGFEVCCRLKSHAATAPIPVLHLSDGPFEDMDFTCHLERGDEAYLTHPVSAAELLACVRMLLRERQTQLQFNSFLEAAPDAVIIVDSEGLIIRVNKQAETIFGYKQQELAGRRVELLMPHRLQERHQVHRTKFAACPSTRPMGAVSDLWGLRKDGSEFPVEINLSPLPSPCGTLVASIIRDVTERKRLEQELRNADRIKNEFLAMLAHELRNPLSSVRAAEQLIRLEMPQTPELVEIFDVIDLQLELMTRLVDDLSDISQITKGKMQFHPERVELGGIATAAAESCRPRIEARGHRLTIALPSQPLYLNADPVRLTQVITNLLNNATKYTEHGGQIWLSAEQHGNDVVVSVRDTGVGISAEMLPKVFDCFTQVDRTRKMAQGGLGIGLSLVRGLVEMHGGSVEARSEGVGHGSEFTVQLPIIHVGEPRHTTDSERQSFPPLHVLVVDDNRSSRFLLPALIGRLGPHDVRVAGSGEEALVVLEAFVADLILLDLGLPDMSGIELARIVRGNESFAKTRIVALTGYDGKEARGAADEIGIDSYHVKPVSLEMLCDVFEELSRPQQV